MTVQGEGKISNGTDSESISCFVRCCSGEAHCSNRKECTTTSKLSRISQYYCSNRQKCVSSSSRCNYRNDCGDSQDEASCYEYCFSKNTGWNSDGWGSLVYFDRHRVYCGGSGNVLTAFYLRRNGGSIRYNYKCCRLKRTICYNQPRYTGWNSDGGGNTIYLDRHSVNCGDYGYINHFQLKRGGRNVQYYYTCCHLYSSYRSTWCYNRYTRFTDTGRGKNYYLDRQTVQCNSRYFLTRFEMQTSGPYRWRYFYRCCRQAY